MGFHNDPPIAGPRSRHTHILEALVKITIFGATGGTGRRFVDQACAAGHDVTAVVRNPAGLVSRSNLAVITANFADAEEIVAAVAGRDAVLTAIGAVGRGPTTVQTDTTTSIVAAMRRTGAQRLICVSSSGIHTAGDGPVTRLIVKPIVQRLQRHSFADMRGMEQVVRASGLAWTIMRPPWLTNGRPTGSYQTEMNGNVRGGFRVSRADLADCMLRCLADQASVRTTISISA
jgi:putative NADH-flavin reductase